MSTITRCAVENTDDEMLAGEFDTIPEAVDAAQAAARNGDAVCLVARRYVYDETEPLRVFTATGLELDGSEWTKFL